MADIKQFINDLNKPFQDMKLKKTALMGKFLGVIETINDIQKSEEKTLNDALKKLGATAKTTAAGLEKPIPVKIPGIPKKEEKIPPIEEPTGAVKKKRKEQESKEDEERKKTEEAQEEQASLLTKLVKGTGETAGAIGDKITEGLDPVTGELKNVNQSVQDALLGPLSGIAESTKQSAINVLKNLRTLIIEKFTTIKERIAQKKRDIKQLKAQKKTTETLEDLFKFTKRQAFIRVLPLLFKPIELGINAILALLTSPAKLLAGLAVALGAVLAKKLAEALSKTPVFKGLKDSITELTGFFKKIFTDPIGSVKKLGEEARDLAKFAFDTRKEAAAGFTAAVKETKEFTKDLTKNSIDLLKDFLRSLTVPFTGKLRPAEKAKDVLDVVKGGLVPVRQGDVVVDKDSLANVLTGAKGAALDKISGKSQSSRDTSMINSLNGIRGEISKGTASAFNNAININQTIQTTAFTGGGSQDDMNKMFFEEMATAQER